MFAGSEGSDGCTACLFFFFSRIGRTDGCFTDVEGFLARREGKESNGLTLRETTAGEKRGKETNKQTKKRVRRRGKGEYGADHELTKWLPSLLDARRPERLCGFNQPDEEQKGERFSRRSSPGLS